MFEIMTHSMVIFQIKNFVSKMYSGVHKTEIIVLPVHPCDKPNKGGCEQICDKDGEKAVCSCVSPYDYTLSANGKTCDKSKE